MFQWHRRSFALSGAGIMHDDCRSHDSAYRAKKLNGYSGWDTDDVIAENLRNLGFLINAVCLRPGFKVLDVGCGAGNISFWLEEKGFEVTGFDCSQAAIDWALEKSVHNASKAFFLCHDAMRDKQDWSRYFDVIVDCHCLHCIVGKDRESYLANLYSWLKPGGFFLLASMCLDKDSGEDSSNIIPNRHIAPGQTIIGELSKTGFSAVSAHIDAEGDGFPELLLVAEKPR
jgi:cyclopropane fatty-acyl-phospholipid synthase-like methyltransferase